ncbi:MAG: hypothetical protein AB7D51_07910 [Desulfovibrionaceae bacterium]
MCNEEERQLIKFFESQDIPKSAYDFHPCGKNHPPDAQARKGNNLISIEHTRLAKQQQKRYSDLRRRILDKCRQLCDWKKYSVHVLFKPDKLHYRNVGPLADEISTIINSHSESIGQDRVRIESDSVILSVRTSPEFERDKWKFIEDTCGWVSQTNDSLIERISAKENHLPKYCNDYDECWLLICYDRYKAHGFFELDLISPIETSFDKIFIMSEGGIEEVKRS